MSEKQFLEVIIVKGDVDNIQELTEKIRGLKGLEYVKLTSMG